MKFKKDKHILGFTLVELIIVIVILGILATLAILSFSQQLFKGNDSRRKADLNRTKIALEEYEKDHNCYPPESTMVKCGTDPDIAIHPYLNNVSCDPVTRQAYFYETDGLSCPRWFRLYSELQNAKDLVAIPGIGPEGVYNYYVSSENAPVPVSVLPSPSSPPLPTSTVPGVVRYGCQRGACRKIVLDENGNPVCYPNYDSPDCYGQCVIDGNPANECVGVGTNFVN